MTAFKCTVCHSIDTAVFTDDLVFCSECYMPENIVEVELDENGEEIVDATDAP